MDAIDSAVAAPPTQASRVGSLKVEDSLKAEDSLKVEDSLRLLMDAADVADAADAATPTNTSDFEKTLRTRMAQYRTQMERILHYKKNGTHLPGLSQNQKRVVMNKCARHVLSNGKLYYIGGKKKLAQEVITNEERAIEILHQYHSNDMGGHHGIIATTNKVVLHYHWNNMNLDIIGFVKNCETCQEMKKPHPPPEPDLMSIINNRPPPTLKKKATRKRKSRIPGVDTGTMYTKVAALDQETQTSAEHRKQNELFLKSLLPSMDQLDEVQIMQFRMDVEQLVMNHLSQARAKKTAAAPPMPPQANPAAFPAAWYHNLDRIHSSY